MNRFCLILAASSLVGSVGAQTAGPVPTQALTDEIEAADEALFSAFFDRCDIPALGRMLADDFEMIHDKGGMVAKDKAEMLAAFERTCSRQKTGEDYRARRELIPQALKVYPVNNFGAIETGEHRFFQLLPGKPEKLVEVALFTHVWKKEPDGWKLAKVLSYDHRLTK
jgi:ketosteroid isomerase-like protein